MTLLGPYPLLRFSRRATLRAALSYVDAGWPIVPGATPCTPPDRTRGRMLSGGRSASVACSCRSANCLTPAAHPLSPDWPDQHVTTEQAARFWWGRDSGPLSNIVLCCGETFDAWSVPAAVGTYALDLIDAGAAPFTPVAITPLWRWHFFTAPTLSSHGVQVPHGLDVLHLGTGQFVPAPPSTRGPIGRDRWLIEPRHRRLPPGRAVAAALALAATRLTAEQPS